MVYWVYENWTAEKKAVIHIAECGNCNNGKGKIKNKTEWRNGGWHGPFDTYDDARTLAEGLEDRVVRDGTCIGWDRKLR